MKLRKKKIRPVEPNAVHVVSDTHLSQLVAGGDKRNYRNILKDISANR